ncbi:MAG: alpha/beta fold hydrolase [Patescibacteria group bacterium]|nr:alpha/beta fold hydrolase [Patescibacteria group bacterium]
MNNVLIFHGTGGYPEENWFPWLKEQLESDTCQVTIPKFPDSKKLFAKACLKVIVPQSPAPDKPEMNAWLKKLEEYKNKIDENTILIGHSLGGLFLLRVLERLDKPVKAAIFVSASIGVKPILFHKGDYDFSGGFEFDWSRIKENAKHFEVFHSDTDKIVSIKNGEELASRLEVKLNIIPNAGHLNAKAGYTKFPQLLEKLKPLLDN